MHCYGYLLAETCDNFLTFLLIAMATCVLLTTRTLESECSVLAVTYYTPFSCVCMRACVLFSTYLNLPPVCVLIELLLTSFNVS